MNIALQLGLIVCFFAFGSSALKCYVGIGNASDPLHSEEEAPSGSSPISHEDGFFLMECGERGSQLVSIEVIMQNITEKIKQSWENFGEKATQWAKSLAGSGRRRKRFVQLWKRYKREANETDLDDEEEIDDDAEILKEAEISAEPEDSTEDENYACVKAMAAGVIYRSCVPKIGLIRLNCTSTFEQNVLCYCHTKACNKATTFWVDHKIKLLIFLLVSLSPF